MSQMQSSLPPAERLAKGKGATACLRCRRRKQKCDLRHPSCSNCEGAGVPCMTYHSQNKSTVPRNYVSELEAEVEKLTRQNRELRARAQSASVNDEMTTPRDNLSPGSLAASDASSNHVQNLVKSVSDVVVEPSRQPRFLGQSGGITLAKLVISAIRVEALTSPLFIEPRSYNHSSSSMAAEASLPPRHAADHLVDVYFQYQTPHLPIVKRSRVEEAIESAYQAASGRDLPDRAVETDIFMSFMIFAIALCDVSNPSGGRPSQSEGCFKSALSLYEKVVTSLESDIETLRTILLLAQFIALCPSRGSLWHLTGIALRLCIDIGLHWESEDQATSVDPAVLYDHRRLWYSTYQFDRILCITLGRPFGIIDESMRVPLPNPWAVYQGASSSESTGFDIYSQRAHNHMFSLSMLESEIKHVQHSQVWAPKIAYPRANYAVWLQDIQPRLEEWYATIPQTTKAHPSSIFAYQAYWDYLYNNAVILLYRPNSTGSQTSPEATVLSFKASCQLIGSIKTLQREGKVDILWKSAHHLFMAGLGVIYSLWQSKEVRDRNPIGSSISALQSCASTLAAMAESFPGVSGCRDAFDTLSEATVDWLVNNNAAELHHGRQEFEKQAEDVLHRLQPSRRAHDCNGMDMSGMLSADSFVFSEMFSSAAQWPEPQHSGFNDMGFDPIARGGSHISL
ncbi:transcriptional regulator family: Fungal Specific TF [Penicillium roqueforti]|uniref:Zn(2)-C6 fungal-type DNA-binding domain n=1 Tax=Penicillium roqueforti (strain FM164) TaxID=1365484 RepID=W6QJK4_PENRF|nr:transcriptional regulator family: Fungal Specific TF [Penicillium roqueforti]CDM36605.1 Zn(2)-C6 fungal-type DNA-binding domain [Penicillium roqueforti FM164]KAF9250255.1 transcriptional regulator family: Fungal Specific TF [Penicillium roqueforti]KAI1832665.1 transcriptional regulator family: Fungal Specific TF [Penicillium roqueforti]KAI2676355.1 transcriptional regulator family: Fungal Specific TF [Penicillium roqueforti]KAI2679705.1 transcriptional regulator family: Fungal Specific TF [